MDTPTPPVLVLVILWMICLGIWIERKRQGGTRDVEARCLFLKEQNTELLADVDRLTARLAQLGVEVDLPTFRQPTAGASLDARDLHVVRSNPGGRR